MAVNGHLSVGERVILLAALFHPAVGMYRHAASQIRQRKSSPAIRAVGRAEQREHRLICVDPIPHFHGYLCATMVCEISVRDCIQDQLKKD
jgi:hypothetical protein